jgi:hypothetical protein
VRRVAPTGPGAGPKGPPLRGLKRSPPPRDPAAGRPTPQAPPDAAGAVPASEAGATQPQPAAQAAPRSFRLADLVTAGLLLALGVLVIGASVRMGIGWGSDGPESGFVPFWLAIVLVGCSAFTILRAARRRSAKVFVRRDELVRVLQVLLPAAAMVAVTPYLGIYVAGAVYMALYMRLAGRYSWAASLALPLAFTLTMFLVFEKWFLVPLPKGPLETWLGY